MTKSTIKHLCQYLFFNKVAAGRPCNFIKKETLVQAFSCEFCHIFKNTFFIGHLRWLLLTILWIVFIQRQLFKGSYRKTAPKTWENSKKNTSSLSLVVTNFLTFRIASLYINQRQLHYKYFYFQLSKLSINNFYLVIATGHSYILTNLLKQFVWLVILLSLLT